VVIDVVDILRIAFREAENHTPVGTNRNRPEVSEVTLEPMEPESWQIHVCGGTGSIKPCEDVPQLWRVFGDYPARIIILVEAFESLVADRPNHVLS
jgi:hypothetical protein